MKKECDQVLKPEWKKVREWEKGREGRRKGGKEAGKMASDSEDIHARCRYPGKFRLARVHI